RKRALRWLSDAARPQARRKRPPPPEGGEGRGSGGASAGSGLHSRGVKLGGEVLLIGQSGMRVRLTEPAWWGSRSGSMAGMTASEQRWAVYALVWALLSVGAAVAGLELGRFGGAVLAIGALILMSRAGDRAQPHSEAR